MGCSAQTLPGAPVGAQPKPGSACIPGCVTAFRWELTQQNGRAIILEAVSWAAPATKEFSDKEFSRRSKKSLWSRLPVRPPIACSCYATTIGGIFRSVYSLQGNAGSDIRFLGFASPRPASALGGFVRGHISKVSSGSDIKMVGYSCGFECLLGSLWKVARRWVE